MYRNNEKQKLFKPIELWNLKTGLKYIITLDKKITKWDINVFLSKTLKINMRNNIIVFNLNRNLKKNKKCSLVDWMSMF